MTAETLEALESETPVVVAEATEEDTTATPVEFQAGDKVRVAEGATSTSGYAVATAIVGMVGTLQYQDTFDGWLVELGDYRSAWVDPQHLSKLTEADLLREELARVTAERDSATQQAESAQAETTRLISEHEAWKANLQEVALQAAEANGMCAVFDRVMEEVGLEGRERELTFRVEFSGVVYLSVTATSQDAARDEIDRHMVYDRIVSSDSYTLTDWQIDDD